MQEKWWHNAVVYQSLSKKFPKDSNGDGLVIYPNNSKLDYLLQLGSP